MDLVGRWALTPEILAERAAWFAALRERLAGRQLCLDFDAPRCNVCEDESEVDCVHCDGDGCRSCDDSGRQPCVCDGGPDECEVDE